MAWAWAIQQKKIYNAFFILWGNEGKTEEKCGPKFHFSLPAFFCLAWIPFNYYTHLVLKQNITEPIFCFLVVEIEKWERAKGKRWSLNVQLCLSPLSHTLPLCFFLDPSFASVVQGCGLRVKVQKTKKKNESAIHGEKRSQQKNKTKKMQ